MLQRIIEPIGKDNVQDNELEKQKKKLRAALKNRAERTSYILWRRQNGNIWKGRG